jgi:hypothetical protein
MKKLSLTSLFRVLSGMVAVIMVLGLFMSVSPVYASADPSVETALKARYYREQKMLINQQATLDKAALKTTKVDALIAKATAKGKDTSMLEAAKAMYVAQLGEANDYHSAAAAILAAHKGFDDLGNVTNVTEARQTVADSHLQLFESRHVIVVAQADLNRNLAEWRRVENIKASKIALERIYKNQQKWLTQQQLRLDHTDVVVANVQKLIDEAKAASKDTTDLEAALTIYKAQVVSAKADHETAVTVLTLHNGFDTAGKVTDETAARQTVMDARQALMNAHMTLVQASYDLHKVIFTWRKSHP